MTDPTEDRAALPFLRDYQIRIPVTGLADRPGGDLIARVPAFDPIEAELIGEHIADRAARALGASVSPSAYSIDNDAITVQDVDDQPSPAEVAAELEHYQRVLAALAKKFPLLLQLTADEYNDADPASVQAVPVGDSVMAFVSGDLPFPTEAVAGGMQTPGVEPVLVPPGDLALPADPGGHPDPDVRLAAPHTLARANHGEVEIIIGGTWYRLDQAVIDHEQGTVTFVTTRGETTVPAGDLVPARPATIDGYGSDLTAAVSLRQQVLTGTGWMTVETAEYMGQTSDTYNVCLSAGDELSRRTSYGHGDEILLRGPRVGWWI